MCLPNFIQQYLNIYSTVTSKRYGYKVTNILVLCEKSAVCYSFFTILQVMRCWEEYSWLVNYIQSSKQNRSMKLLFVNIALFLCFVAISHTSDSLISSLKTACYNTHNCISLDKNLAQNVCFLLVEVCLITYQVNLILLVLFSNKFLQLVSNISLEYTSSSIST